MKGPKTMIRLFRLGTFAAAIALFMGATIRAEDKPTAKSQTYAVVVGVGTFADKEIKPRPTADEDAKTIAGLLSDKSVGGVPTDHISVFLSASDEKFGAKEGTKANILKAIGDAVGKVGKDDTLLIYMVMQGATAGEKPCLFATDSTFKDRAKDGIFGGDLEEKFKDLKAEQVATFLDFNLKAYESKEAVLAPNINDFVRVFLGLKEKDADAEPPPGRVVFLSGFGIQPPISVGKNGLFTSVVADALSGKADVEGYEADGVVTLDEAHKYIEKHIQELAKTAGKTTEEKQQRLVFVGRGIHFVLTRNPEAAAKSEARLKKYEERKSESKLDAELAEEGEKLLTRMPRLKAMQEMRKSYQKFADGDLTVDQLKSARDRIKESMVLSDNAAKSFSEKTFEGLSVIKANYIKKLNLGEMVGQGIKGMYKVTEVKLPDDLKERVSKAKDLSDKEVKQLLKDARVLVGKREDLENNKDVELAMNAAMIKFVDPYTTYIDKERVGELEKDIDGRFRGIGVQIRQDVARDGLLVVTPIRGSPAYKAGMLAGDLITEIIRETDSEGKPLPSPEVTSTKGMATTDAVKLITGLPSTKVRLKLEREGESEPIFKDLVRDTVTVESVYGYKRNPKDDSWDYYVDPKNKIAYIYLYQFARNTAEDTKKAIEKLSKDGVKGVVLDMRFNPGGLLTSAVEICDLFVDDGVLVSIRPGNSRANERMIKGHSEGSFLNFPMVVLVNEGSASGSEVVAGCLQDHSRAIIMGERSYGKGSVQNVETFAETGGKIKMTTATFWPPSGRNLNKASTTGKEEEEWGVRPDKGYDLKLDRAEKDELFERIYNWSVIPRRDIPAKEVKKDFKDRQLEMALEYLRGQIKVTRNDKEPGKDG
jgi:carboxyl-terminal processing protease